MAADSSVDSLPGDAIGKMSEPAAANRDWRTHRVVTCRGGGHAYLADQCAHLRRIPPVSSISEAWIIEQRVVALQARENLGFDKPHAPIARCNHVFGKLKADCAHVIISVLRPGTAAGETDFSCKANSSRERLYAVVFSGC